VTVDPTLLSKLVSELGSIELVTVDPRTKIEGFLSGMEGMYNIAWDGEGAAVISFASEQAR
jgi:hypothetical protein